MKRIIDEILYRMQYCLMKNKFFRIGNKIQDLRNIINPLPF